MQVHKLLLLAGQAIDGLGHGAHRLARRGRGQTFREHRSYCPGDDLRHLDWHVAARKDTLMVKVFEDEAPLRVEVLLDASGSMAEHSKLQRAKVLALAAAQVALSAGEEVGLWASGPIGSPLVRLAASRKGRGHSTALARALQALPGQGHKPPSTALVALAHALKRRSHVIVITDGWLSVGPLGTALAGLRARRHDVTLVHVMHQQEQTLPLLGQVTWQGTEGEEEVLADAQQLRSDFEARVAAHRLQMQHLCVARNIAYVAAPDTLQSHALLYLVLTAQSRRLRPPSSRA